jgi:cold shock protein
MTQKLTIDQTSDSMATGTVEFYDSGTGFGFIQPDDGGNGAFVHVSALARAEMPDLFEGQKVSFQVEVDKRSGKSFVLRIK